MPDQSPPKLALSRSEAAQALSMSLDSFERHVQPHVRLLRRGRLRLVLIRDLEAWLEREAEPPITDQVREVGR